MTIFSKSNLFLAGMLSGAVLTACGGPSLHIKPWYLDSAQGGLIRKHDKAPTEILSFEQAKAYRCVSPKDFDLLVTVAKTGTIPEGK